MKIKKYPKHFLNNRGIICARKSKELSFDKTPRYIINPKCPSNTYPLQYCIDNWTAIY